MSLWDDISLSQYSLQNTPVDVKVFNLVPNGPQTLLREYQGHRNELSVVGREETP